MGDRSDIARVCKQVMNKAVTKRIISKQEACVLLGELDLVSCTETIQSVSISDSKMVALSEDMKKSSQKKMFINEYKSRPPEFEDYSLHAYFHHTRNSSSQGKLIIPNFVGVNGTPKFPVTDDYARHTLIVHRPWRVYPSTSTPWRAEFEDFINSP